MSDEQEVLQAGAVAVHQPTPMGLLQIAMERGASIEQMQQLMDLQERHEANEARKAFVAAMSAFKADAPRILKNKEVSFGAGKTAYKHATLDDASEKIGKSLSEHGLSHTWDVEQLDGGMIKVTCRITHILGHSESVTMQASPDTSGSKNSIQAIGSTTSYLQRYTLFAASGIAPSDADDDARGGAEGLTEKEVADWHAAIEAVTSLDAASGLWQKIAEACTVAGDVPSYDTLKGAMAKKRKALSDQKGAA
jgi:hypothetical protein